MTDLQTSHPVLVEDMFVRKVGMIPYKPKGIFPSEMFLFFKLAADFGSMDQIFESGSGLSTLYLSTLFPHVPITTVDINLGKLFTVRLKGVDAVSGDSKLLLPKMIQKSLANRIAVLIDGPKQKEAVELAKICMQDGRVTFVAVHDLEQHLIKDRFNTRCDAYRLKYGHLDKNVGEYLIKYPVGPGLTIFNYGEAIL